MSGGASDVTITPDVIRRRAGNFDLMSVQWLDLAECGVREVAHLEACVNLRALDLRGNKVVEVATPSSPRKPMVLHACSLLVLMLVTTLVCFLVRAV
jgi:hypothetical protein